MRSQVRKWGFSPFNILRQKCFRLVILIEEFAHFSFLYLVTLKVTERPIENKKQVLLNKDELNTRIKNEDDIGESEQEV